MPMISCHVAVPIGPFSFSDIVQGPPVEPTPDALQVYIAELERELRNADFRLQHLYHSRAATHSLLTEAKRQADKFKK
jgi:hypothetical protein